MGAGHNKTLQLSGFLTSPRSHLSYRIDIIRGMTMRIGLHGLIAAPFTAFTASGELALDRIAAQCESLVADGVTGAFICGTTGEGVAMSVAERQQVAARWQAVAPGGFPILVHVGALSLVDARALAAHAEAIGAAGVAVLPPCFIKPTTAASVVDWIAAVASACPNTPVSYYHIPSLSGVSVNIHAVMSAAVARIANFAGVKFTFEDLNDYGRCVTTFGDDCDVAFGRDEMLLPALAIGARAAVGSTYNVAAPLYQRMITAFMAGDLATAQREQERARALIAVLIRHRSLPALKALMSLRGVPCGPCRLPLVSLTTAEIDALQTDLAQARVLDVVLPTAQEATA
jgi:N-acetylneuraminate lyase